MQLIGMLDSPYVRRVAISLQLMGVPFEHRSISVFRTFEEFRAINPVVKAPTLVCDDGTVLMDSTLMIDYAQGLPVARRGLMPLDPGGRTQALRVIGLALAACEKSVQIVYENNLRPPEKRHDPWLERVAGQLAAAFAALEVEFERHPRAAASASIDQAGLTSAVTWHFAREMVPGQVDPAAYPRLRAFAAQAEALPEFRAAPHGAATYPAA